MEKKCPHCTTAIPATATGCPNCGAAISLDPGVDTFIGRTILNQYIIKKKLGEGGYGAVYEAYQPSIERKVAVKTLHRHLTHHASTVARFRREGAAASRLSHPSAVRVYNVGETEDGILWLAMEFLEGETLLQRVNRTGPLSEEGLLEILLPICEVLQEAHQKGIYHRDLKPENIFLTQNEEGRLLPKLLDFGVATLLDSEIRATQSGMITGTPAYMSPEQWKGLKHADGRSDIYALGIIAYQCLSGQLPFAAATAPEFMQKHCLEPPLDLATAMGGHPLSPALRSVVMRALAKNPDERYQTPLEFKQALERAFSDPFQEEPIPESVLGGASSGRQALAMQATLAPSATMPAGTEATLIPRTRQFSRSRPSVTPIAKADTPAAEEQRYQETISTRQASPSRRKMLLVGAGVYAILLLLVSVYAIGFFSSGEESADATGGTGDEAGSQFTVRWHWDSPLPQGNLLTDVWGSEQSDIYAVGWGGTILQTIDSGQTWMRKASGVPQDLTGIWGSFWGDVYVVGDEGVILHSTDRGERWQKLKSGVDVRLEGVWGSGRGDVYVVGEKGVILHSRDEGKTWEKQTSNTKRDLYDVWGSSPGDVYAVGSYGTVLHSLDGGATWTSQRIDTTEDLYGVWGSGKNDVYFVGAHGVIFHSADGAQSWQKQESGTTENLLAIWGSSADNIFAVGEKGLILHSSDRGKTWQKQTSKGDEHLYAVWGSSPENVYAVGDFGEILRREGGGVSWASQREGLKEDILDVWVAPTGEVFAVGIKGLALRAASGSEEFLPLQSGVTTDIDDIRGSSAQNLFAVGYGGLILRSYDGGTTWSAKESGTDKNLFGLLVLSEKEAFAMGGGGTLLYTEDGGESWEPRKSGTAEDLWRGCQSPQGNLFLIGNKGTILRSRDKTSWTLLKSNTTKDLWALFCGKSGVYAAGDAGTILYSRDEGETWEQAKNDVNAGFGGLWGSDAGDLYVAGDRGTILHSADEGKTWTRQWTGSTRDLWALWGNAAGDVYVVGLKGTILHSLSKE